MVLQINQHQHRIYKSKPKIIKPHAHSVSSASLENSSTNPTNFPATKKQAKITRTGTTSKKSSSGHHPKNPQETL